MISPNNKGSIKKQTLLGLYNMIPNLIWSIIHLTPIVIFCFTRIEPSLVYIFLCISLVPVFLKNSLIDRLQAGKTTAFYKKIGVPVINKVAQNGDIINSLLKKKFPDHKTVTHDPSSIARLINQTYVFEKFHLVLFLFFSLVIIYSLLNSYWCWALVIFVTNLAYNIYPNFLQQYIRLKLRLFKKRMERGPE